MNPKNQHTLLIEQFLLNQLSVEDKAQVERRMQLDQSFNLEVKLQQEVMKGLERWGLQQELHRLHRRMYGPKWGLWIVVVVVAIALATGALWLSSKPERSHVRNEKAEATLDLLDPTLKRAFPQAQEDVQHFVIDPRKEETITGAFGTKVTFPENCWQMGDHHDLSLIDVYLIEALNPIDFVKYNLPTIAENKLLTSGGMVYLEARWQNRPDTRVTLRREVPIQIDIPAQGEIDCAMRPWVLDTLRGKRQWREVAIAQPDLCVVEPECDKVIQPRIQQKVDTVEVEEIEMDLLEADEEPVEALLLPSLEMAKHLNHPLPWKSLLQFEFHQSEDEEDYGIIETEKVSESSYFERGLNLFERDCRACHNVKGLDNDTTMNLAGITVKRSEDWLRKFIQHPGRPVMRIHPIYKARKRTIMHRGASEARYSCETVSALLTYLDRCQDVTKNEEAVGTPPEVRLELGDSVGTEVIQKTTVVKRYKIANPAQMRGYLMSVNELGWINCDRFYNATQKVDFKVEIKGNQGANSTHLFVVFPEINSMTSAKWNESTKGISQQVNYGRWLNFQRCEFNQVAAGIPAKVIGMSRVNGELKLGIMEASVTSVPIQLELKTTDPLEVEKKLKVLLEVHRSK